MKAIISCLVVLTLVGCGGGDKQNSAICGFTLTAGANRVLDQLTNYHAVLDEPPEELTAGFVPTRVFGFATGRSMAVESGETVTLAYEGEGLPSLPGFALALVDDSSEVFRGIMIYETDPPVDYPELGVVGQGVDSVPLFGLRVHWSSVNDDSCPIFTPADTTQ